MEFAAAHQPSRDVGCLQQGALRRKMGGQISRNGDKDMPALVVIAPLAKLPHPSLEHLVSVKARILAKERLRERRDQRLGRVTQGKVASDKPRRSIDLLLTVESVEQSGADIPC